MKNIIKLISVSVLSCAVASCNFLDENMSTKYTEAQIYGSETSVESAITGCYASFRGAGFLSGSLNEWFQPASAVIHWGGTTTRLTDGQKRWVDCLYLTRFAKDPNNLANFKAFYTTIYKCNKVLIDLQNSPVSEEYKTKVAGEAYFLRAMSYFYLTRIWGNVPMHLEAATTIAETSKPRAPFWEVYKQIIDDLTIAEKTMRSYDEQYKIVNLSGGRVCNYAATAAKSIVYLTIGTLLAHHDDKDNFWVCTNEEVAEGFKAMGLGDGNIENAAKAAFELARDNAKWTIGEDVPGKECPIKTATPYKLADHYADLFKWTDLEDFQLRERIFCLTNSNEAGGSNLAMWSLPPNYMDSGKNTKATNYGRIRPSRFLFQKWCQSYGGVPGTGTYNQNICVKCGDPRIDAAFVYDTFPGKDMASTYCYPNSSCIYTTNEYAKCTPYFKKYYDPKYDYTPGYADMYIIRLAEMYLVAAEAEANLDDFDSAILHVNAILARARQKTDGSVSAEPADWTNTYTKDELLEKIFWERCFELTGEQHEYFDTHRMGAKWFSKYVTTPHNLFLTLEEQDDYLDKDGITLISGYRSTQYGADRFGEGCIFPEKPEEVRKGLISAYPNDELVYNTALTLADQNPSEIFWE